jgi:hypothetical protein
LIVNHGARITPAVINDVAWLVLFGGVVSFLGRVFTTAERGLTDEHDDKILYDVSVYFG